jgi:hypothetical protein
VAENEGQVKGEAIGEEGRLGPPMREVSFSDSANAIASATGFTRINRRPQLSAASRLRAILSLPEPEASERLGELLGDLLIQRMKQDHGLVRAVQSLIGETVFSEPEFVDIQS